MSVAARATSIAVRAKPSIAGAVVLAAIALAPWAHSDRHSDQAPVVAVAASPEPGFEAAPHRILLVPEDGEAWGRRYVDSDMVLTPPPHPDARPYPQGMVIGMGARSVDPGILVWDGSPLANMLSVILAPWRALAGLRGT
jgi:hypothetical protein